MLTHELDQPSGVSLTNSPEHPSVSIHLSHYLPTEKCEVSRLRTGYEKVIAHRCNPPFAYSAEADGVIESIDNEAKVMRVKYKDRVVAVSFGDDYTKNGGGGFYCTQNIAINGFKQGDKVKRGDIILYNDRFFTSDPYSKQVNWNIGVLKDVVLMDSDATMEDSCIMDTELAKDLAFNPVHIRDITVTKRTVIHRYAAIGTQVKSIDPLMIFDQSELSQDMFGGLDDEAIRLLGKINKKTPKAKFSGTVVALDAFYVGGIQDMVPSVRGLVSLINRIKYKKNQAAKGAVNQASYPVAQNITQTDRIGITDLDKDTVIFRFYIKQDMGMHGGDKVEFDSSLKSVCTGIADHPWVSEDGTMTAHALFSAVGIADRIINSPMIEGMANKILETAEQQILKMYFD